MNDTPCLPLILPRWPAPASVIAFASTRLGGCSGPPFNSLNLADHVGDVPATVARNRALLGVRTPRLRHWQHMRQVHGSRVVRIDRPIDPPQADALVTDVPGLACAVATADCLPVLLCDRAGREVAAVHAGWRGLAGGVLEAAVGAMRAPAGQLLAWIGPAISAAAYEVDAAVRDALCAAEAADAVCLQATRPGHWLADLPALAQRRLARLGVTEVSWSGHCTLSQPALFFSYRRDGSTGRMLTVIGLAGR